MFVKPSPGLKIRCPITKRLLPDSGKEVSETAYWMRRLASGDVIVVQPNQIPDFKTKG